MFKFQKIHLESDHKFIRDDEGKFGACNNTDVIFSLMNMGMLLQISIVNLMTIILSSIRKRILEITTRPDLEEILSHGIRLCITIPITRVRNLAWKVHNAIRITVILVS